MKRTDRRASINPAVRERWREATTLSQFGQADAAAEELRAALRLDPDCIETWVRLAGVYGRADCWEEAIAVCREATRRHPASAELYQEMGGICCDFERWEESLAAYRRASELDPENEFSRAQVGSLLEELGRVEEALCVYRDMLQPMPPGAGSGSASDDCQWLRGAAFLTALLQRTGLLDDTIARLREAIRSHPDPGSLVREE
jgi:tetratricopeptide (TPR) repeat protein